MHWDITEPVIDTVLIAFNCLQESVIFYNRNEFGFGLHFASDDIQKFNLLHGVGLSDSVVEYVAEFTNIRPARKRVPVTKSLSLHPLHICLVIKFPIISCSSGMSICFGNDLGKMASRVDSTILT